MKLEVPHSVILPDGSVAEVKGVFAKVIEGQLAQIVYTVERESGAWMDVESEEANLQDAGDIQVAPDTGHRRSSVNLSVS